MNEQRTEHLVFLPCSISMARSLLLYAEALRENAPVFIPESLPSIQAKATLPYLIEGLEREWEPLSWLWFVIDIEKKRLVGELILGKKQYEDNAIQFTFTFDSVDSEIAYAEESVDWLLTFLEGQKIKYVITEVGKGAYMAQAMLEQKGFHCFERDHFIQLVHKIR